MQESFLQNVIVGLILVGYFASHVMCRKLASYKSAENFPTKCFLGINLNTTVSILNMLCGYARKNTKLKECHRVVTPASGFTELVSI